MPAAMAWWNLLQEQFAQAVATAITPTTPAQPPAPAGGEAAKPGAPHKDAPPAAGTAKPRASRSRSDKT
jgi:hypothetical protein